MDNIDRIILSSKERSKEKQLEQLAKEVSDYIMTNSSDTAKKILSEGNATVDSVVEITEVKTGKECTAWEQLKSLANKCKDFCLPILAKIKDIIVYLVKVALKYTKYCASKLSNLITVAVDKLNRGANSSYEDEDCIYED